MAYGFSFLCFPFLLCYAIKSWWFEGETKTRARVSKDVISPETPLGNSFLFHYRHLITMKKKVGNNRGLLLTVCICLCVCVLEITRKRIVQDSKRQQLQHRWRRIKKYGRVELRIQTRDMLQYNRHSLCVSVNIAETTQTKITLSSIATAHIHWIENATPVSIRPSTAHKLQSVTCFFV